jgi:hypothetical protein
LNPWTEERKKGRTRKPFSRLHFISSSSIYAPKALKVRTAFLRVRLNCHHGMQDGKELLTLLARNLNRFPIIINLLEPAGGDIPDNPEWEFGPADWAVCKSSWSGDFDWAIGRRCRRGEDQRRTFGQTLQINPRKQQPQGFPCIFHLLG